MGIKVENRFVVPAPIDTAWATLLDMPRVVPCMPGTEFTEAIDDRRFRATARIKVGPVELQFRGEGELVEVDATAHRARLKARGSDAKGRGTFQADLTFALTAADDATEGSVDTDLTLSGSVAQYGRGVGLVKEITQQLTTQFSVNLAALIAADRVVRAASARPSLVAEPPAVAPDAPAAVAVGEAVVQAPVATADEAVTSPPVGVVPEPTPSPAPASSPALRLPPTPAPPSAAPPAVAISGLSLLWRALKSMLLRWLGRHP